MNRPEVLRAGLERARALGFLGPGAVDDHVQHAEGFAAATRRRLGHEPASLLDLGSGGGVPGLVLARSWPEIGVALVESGHRRCEHLRMEIERLGWTGRVEVIEERAERVAHSSELRERWELVTAWSSRAFPAVRMRLYWEGWRKPAMAINGRRNKPFGPGGGTRRLHPSPARPGLGGGETGSTRA